MASLSPTHTWSSVSHGTGTHKVTITPLKSGIGMGNPREMTVLCGVYVSSSFQPFALGQFMVTHGMLGLSFHKTVFGQVRFCHFVAL